MLNNQPFSVAILVSSTISNQLIELQF